MVNLTCGNCHKVSTADEWDKKTLALCLNRVHRRKFKGVQATAGQKRWYLCPKCGEKIMRDSITEVQGEQ